MKRRATIVAAVIGYSSPADIALDDFGISVVVPSLNDEAGHLHNNQKFI